MSTHSEDEALELGSESALAALAVLSRKTEALTPGDHLQWWIGFVTATLRAAESSVGEAAFRALRRSLIDEEDTAEAVLAVARRLHAAGAWDLTAAATGTTGAAGRTKKEEKQ